MVAQRRQGQRKCLRVGDDILHRLQLGHVVARFGWHSQARIIGRQAGALVALDGALHTAFTPVVRGQGEVPVTEHAVQAGQVIECCAGRGQDIAAVVAKDVLLEGKVASGARHELPHARSARARQGLRIERALDERQQRQLGRQIAFLHLFDDVEQVAPAAFGHALYVFRLAGVVILALAHKVVVEVGDAEAVAHALPEIGLRHAVVEIDRDFRAPRVNRRCNDGFRRRSANCRDGGGLCGDDGRRRGRGGRCCQRDRGCRCGTAFDGYRPGPGARRQCGRDEQGDGLAGSARRA